MESRAESKTRPRNGESSSDAHVSNKRRCTGRIADYHHVYNNGPPYSPPRETFPHLDGQNTDLNHHEDRYVDYLLSSQLSEGIQDDPRDLIADDEPLLDFVHLEYFTNPQPQTPDHINLSNPSDQMIHDAPSFGHKFTSLSNIDMTVSSRERAEPPVPRIVIRPSTTNSPSVSNDSETTNRENPQGDMNECSLEHEVEIDKHGVSVLEGRFVLRNASSSTHISPKKKPASPENQKQTTERRHTGTCQRCKGMHERCKEWDPSTRGACERCSELSPWKYICFPVKLSDIKGPWNTAEFSILQSPHYLNIQSWISRKKSFLVSDGFDTSFVVNVEEYQPHDSNLLGNDLTWGSKSRVGQTDSYLAYGIRTQLSSKVHHDDMLYQLLSTPLRMYIDRQIPLLLERYQNNGDCNQLYIYMLSCARDIFDKPPGQDHEWPQLLLQSVRIWAVQKTLYQHDWRILMQNDQSERQCTVDSFGVGPNSTISTPPLLKAQLDSVLERLLIEYNQAYILSLEKILCKVMSQRKRLSPQLVSDQKKGWKEMFLSMFMYLDALESYSWTLQDWMTRSMACPPTVTLENLQGLLYQTGYLADCLMASNRNVYFKGYVPFEQPLDSDKLQEQRGEAFEFIEFIHGLIQDPRTKEDIVACMNARYRFEDRNSLRMKYSSRLFIPYENHLREILENMHTASIGGS